MGLTKLLSTLKAIMLMLAPQFKSADSKEGIKETTEALVAVNEISLFIAKRLQDGIGMDDAVATWDKMKNDEEFKALVYAGYDKYDKIPSEVKDVDAGEGMELAAVQIDFVPRFVETFKKPEVVAPVAETTAETTPSA